MGTAIVVCLVGWAAYAPIVSRVDFLDPSSAERELLRFLATLPKDAVIKCDGTMTHQLSVAD